MIVALTRKVKLANKPKQTMAEALTDVSALQVVAAMYGGTAGQNLAATGQNLAGTDKSARQLLFYNLAQV